ncbi:SH3 domain-containing protein [Synechococcus sp. PCC 7502]|uniref:SH3 domain-containing protein n=1 Tax=Synechococcus sp. PCC 7502 TaxID=1173263 RepID=UPI00029FA989|nr:SH3 domain-containing protein [Synechococcus sp. PCC 7502]AFY72420.1 SH3 domain-containing protein [Synechococcus sp. PCC 7502]
MIINRVKKTISVLLIGFACLCLNVWMSPVAIAFESTQNNQSNQELNRPATLSALDRNFPIKVYDQPNAVNGKNELGYGLSGDKVTLLQKVGSNNGQSWYLVRFDNASKSEGWVSDNYISLSPQEAPLSRYLGNQTGQQQQTSQQNQQGFYSQR